MSRTNKDKPNKVKFPEFYPYSKEAEKPKKRKEEDTEWHWLGSTPSWWNRLFHTKPKRRAGHMEEKDLVGLDVEDLEELVETDVTNKPHKYFY